MFLFSFFFCGFEFGFALGDGVGGDAVVVVWSGGVSGVVGLGREGETHGLDRKSLGVAGAGPQGIFAWCSNLDMVSI